MLKMEYSRRSLILMMVLCVAGVVADPMLCIDDEFNGGKSVLFDIENDNDMDISKYDESPWEDLEPPDELNGYVLVFRNVKEIESRAIRVTKGSVIKFLYYTKEFIKSDAVTITVYDVNDPDNNVKENIEGLSSWEEVTLNWEVDVVDIKIKINTISKENDYFFALDQVNILIEESDLTCPAISTTPESTTPESSTLDSSTLDSSTLDSSTLDSSIPDSSTLDSTTSDSSTLDSTTSDSSIPDSSTSDTTDPDLCPNPSSETPEKCEGLKELEEELDLWKTLMIAGWSVAGVAVISTITLGVLLAKKSTSEPSIDEGWLKTGYPSDYSTVGSAGLPRLQPKPRRY